METERCERLRKETTTKGTNYTKDNHIYLSCNSCLSQLDNLD